MKQQAGKKKRIKLTDKRNPKVNKKHILSEEIKEPHHEKKG